MATIEELESAPQPDLDEVLERMVKGFVTKYSYPHTRPNCIEDISKIIAHVRAHR